MNRAERRRIDRKLKRLRRDHCSFCRQDFPHNSRTVTGLTADGEAHRLRTGPMH